MSEPVSENEKDLFRLRNACDIANAWSGYPTENVEVVSGTGQVIYPPTDNPAKEDSEVAEPVFVEVGPADRARATADYLSSCVLLVDQQIALAQVYALLALVERLVQLDTGIKEYFDRDSGRG